MEFVLGELRMNPDLTFADLKSRAALNRIQVYPVTYGRAKTMLGLIPMKPRAAREPKEPKPQAAAETATTPESASPSDRPRAAAGRPMGARMAWLLEQLEARPTMSFHEIAEAGKAAGITVTPQVFSVARTRLGLTRPRGTQRAQTPAVEAGTPTTTGPRAHEARTGGRRRRTPGARQATRSDAQTAFDLGALVATIREIEAERNNLRAALERIAAIVDELR